jgi:hypothetical protein
MTTEEEMTIDERRKCLRRMKSRYIKAKRQERSQLLDEMEAVTGLHRKSLTRLMNSNLERKSRSREPGKTYGPEVSKMIRVIAASLDHPCAERLTPNLVWMARHLTAHDELQVSEPLLLLLEQVSISTVERRLKTIRQDQPRLARRRPRPANRLLRDVPMRPIPWDVGEPGHFETDLVHHSGPSASGEFVCSVQMIDVATGWSERVAVLGRSYIVMQDAFGRMLARLPFPVLELHPDNGTEFFNHHLLRFWTKKVQGVSLSRSRPYHKNDNRFVEQKNDTLVRAYVGYERLDTVAQTLALNRLYDKMWVYYNLFQPVMRLTDKTVIRQEGQPARIKRRYAPARTPFDRLCATNVMLPQHQQQLEALRDRTNPRRLRQEIYDAIDHLFSLPNAVTGVPEDIHHTLLSHSDADKGGNSPFPFSFNRTIILDN